MRQYQQLAGMTLIELLIVIMIMGFLSSLVVPDVRNQLERASAQEEFMRLQSELNFQGWQCHGHRIGLRADDFQIDFGTEASPVLLFIL